VAHVKWEDGTIECFDNFGSRMTTKQILAGLTYPHIPWVGDVRTVVDVGANCGAASTWFSHLYPRATVWALEPGAVPFQLIERNAKRYRPVNVGLHDHDGVMPLFQGVDDSSNASIIPSRYTTDVAEKIRMCEAAKWLTEHNVDTIDVWKLNTEGCELPILQSARSWLPATKVLYIEYHSEHDRRALDELVAKSHVLVMGRSLVDYGGLVYVRRDLMPDADTVADWSRQVSAAGHG
jgi:FkbM family methyltransferase